LGYTFPKGLRQNLKSRKKMKKVLLLLLGLLLIGLIAYFCFQDKVDTIKGSLETSATNTLQSNNLKGIEAKLLGSGFESTSIMKLSGEVNTAEEKETAGRLVASLAGITGIDNQLQVTTPTQTALTPTLTIEDKVDKTIKKLKESEVLPTIKEEVTPEANIVSPYIATIQKDKNNHVVLDGYVESEQVKEMIVKKAHKLFGTSNVTDNLKIASGQPESWSKVIELGLDKLHDVDYGELNLHDENYAFNGFLSSTNNVELIKKEILDSANKEMSNYSNYLGGFEINLPEKAPVAVAVEPEPKPVEKVTQQDTTIKTPKACQKALKELTSKSKILFDYNKATIKKSSTPLLDEIVKTLQTCNLEKIKMVEIGGHTDSIGSYDYNKILSQKRANSVKNYITQHGIDNTKLKAIGYGERNPIVSNMLKSGRAKNRRIEFIIKEIN
jgi:outer membrane protein OmpA-like peptidoglycan-associated protein/osmotically-inducible protein OsmY